jgi:hypothetical protein
VADPAACGAFGAADRQGRGCAAASGRAGEACAQRRNQLDALGKIEQQAPVLSGELPGNIETHLINSLGVRARSAGMLLDFKAGEDELVQTFPFTEEALRQWLALLNATFRKAEWKEDIWPKWITAKGWNEGPDALRLN